MITKTKSRVRKVANKSVDIAIGGVCLYSAYTIYKLTVKVSDQENQLNVLRHTLQVLEKTDPKMASDVLTESITDIDRVLGVLGTSHDKVAELFNAAIGQPGRMYHQVIEEVTA